MKFKTVSGKLDVSSTHVPGRGSGIFDFRTGNHAEFEVACSLNLPAEKMVCIVTILFELVSSHTEKTAEA